MVKRSQSFSSLSYRYFLLAGLLFGVLLHLLLSGQVLAKPERDTSAGESSAAAKEFLLPITSFNGAGIPDWSQISLFELGVESSGFFDLPAGELIQWNPGTSVADILSLGSLESLGVGQLRLADIELISGFSLGSFNLADFQLLHWQTASDLVNAIPDLALERVIDIPPLNDLFNQIIPGFDPTQTLSEVMENFPSVSGVALDAIDLSDYNLLTIPGLDYAELKNFYEWDKSLVSGVPGLEEVPISQFPEPPVPVGTVVGNIDISFEELESDRFRSISGSYQQGFNVPCDPGAECAHIEIEGDGLLEGTHWMSGKFQEVSGGFGVLGSVNGGKEPTGRHPFGEAFKVVVWETDEGLASVELALFFRYCQSLLGCTPYFLGPVPFAVLREEDSIFLGLPLSAPGGDGGVNPALRSYQKTKGRSPEFSLNYSVLASALINQLRWQDASWSAMQLLDCNLSYCTWKLGRFGLSSRQKTVRSAIASASGGKAVLRLLDGGKSLDSEQLRFVFPPEVQQALFVQRLRELESIARQQIDSQTSKPFEGERLVERMARMYLGGEFIPEDGEIQLPYVEGFSVGDYGRQVLQDYRDRQLQ